MMMIVMISKMAMDRSPLPLRMAMLLGGIVHPHMIDMWLEGLNQQTVKCLIDNDKESSYYPFLTIIKIYAFKSITMIELIIKH